MKLNIFTYFVCAVLAISSASAFGAVAIVPTGGGTAAITYEGPANFVSTTPPGFGPMILEDTMVSKTFTSMDPIVIDGTYGPGDLDFGNGFRWTETVTNSTTNAWYGYEFTLTDPAIFFSDLPTFSPSFVTIVPGAPPTIAKSPATDAFGSITLSGDMKSLFLGFAAPVLPGESFSIHAPFWGLAAPEGTFQLTQTAVVPELGMCLTWACLGMTFASVVGLRRWRVRK
jgi:hypothetical protein